MKPSHAQRIAQGLDLHRQGQLSQAHAIYQSILSEEPLNPIALHYLGVILSQTGHYSEAFSLLKRALALCPQDADIWSNLARVSLATQQWDDALASAQHSIAIKPLHADAWCHAGQSLLRKNRVDDAFRHLSRSIEINPHQPFARKYRAFCLQQATHHAAALDDCNRALKLLPQDMELHQLRAELLQHLHQLAEADAEYQIVLTANPNNAKALYGRGETLRVMGNHRAAAESFGKCLQLNVPYDWLWGKWIHSLDWICDWSEHVRLPDLESKVRQGLPTLTPFIASTLSDDPALLLHVSRIYAQIVYQNKSAADSYGEGSATLPAHPRKNRIRIGYYSSDFRTHPMAMLIPEVIESHNRQDFEVYLFSLTLCPNDSFRERLQKAADHFIELGHLDDSAATHLSREFGIDIAIDLMGYTGRCRHELFMRRCAPVQAAWLGMPMSSGSPAIDYIIADPVVIPEQNLSHTSEKVVHLPCYWPNDSQRVISQKTPSRESASLPEDAFVFCCFNSTFKIQPETFACWMRILKATPGSVLWLLQCNDDCSANLRSEAARNGVHPGRIIVAEHMPVEEHLARHRLADLFLDTFPYNAHTTCVDALWAGLPVLTRSGRSFPSRVAASILRRIGLPELITDNPTDYEARAIHLANHGRAELATIRQKLNECRLTSPLFDGKVFAQDLENAYRAMYEKSQSGMKPDFISVT